MIKRGTRKDEEEGTASAVPDPRRKRPVRKAIKGALNKARLSPPEDKGRSHG